MSLVCLAWLIVLGKTARLARLRLATARDNLPECWICERTMWQDGVEARIPPDGTWNECWRVVHRRCARRGRLDRRAVGKA
jgi:hypothetical protein